MRGVADDSWLDAAQNQNSGSEKLFVRFNLEPVKNETESAKAGRPIYRDVEYIKIVVPGDKLNIIHRAVREQDKQKFARQYQAWKAGIDQDIVTGTPLSEWTGISRSQVEELAFFGVRSVEQLADLNDSNAQNFAGIQALKARARDFLEKAKGNAPLDQMRAELAARDNQIETLQRLMKEQGEALSKLQKKANKEVSHGNSTS